MARSFRGLVLLLAIAGAAACTVKETKVPPLAGPSELGLSLTLQASPDVLSQDGSSQSTLTIIARDPNAQPVRGVTARVEISQNGTIADYGTLSTRQVTTGSDGRAIVVYTAPPAPIAVTANYSTVTLLVTPVGTDFSNAQSRTVSIRLVPPGGIIPPSSATAGFAFSPATPKENEAVGFDGSLCAVSGASNCSTGGVVGWSWTFGDGVSGTGAIVSHTYTRSGTYSVTLTVVDGEGRAASTTRYVTVLASEGPTAAFEVSPTNPTITLLPDGTTGAIVYVNAMASKAAAGRSITAYNWDFGDGKLKAGVQQDHTYRAAATYMITLTVTDDMGRVATVSKSIQVK